jgi:hypothetical protein
MKKCRVEETLEVEGIGDGAELRAFTVSSKSNRAKRGTMKARF